MSGYDLIKFFESYGGVIHIQIISSVEINQREKLSSYDFWGTLKGVPNKVTSVIPPLLTGAEVLPFSVFYEKVFWNSCLGN